MSDRPDWFVAVKIPAGKLEDYMMFAYQNGGELREFAPEFAKTIEEMTQALPGASPALPNGKPAAITDQTQPKKPRKGPRPKAETGFDPSTCRGFILKHLRRRPRTSRELRELAAEKQVEWELKGIDSRIYEMRESKWVKITPKGWDLTDEGRRISELTVGGTPKKEKTNGTVGRPPKGDRTHTDVAEEFLQAAYVRGEKQVPGKDVATEFERLGLRGRSAATAIHFLKSKGKVAFGADAATYTWIPPEQRQQETK